MMDNMSFLNDLMMEGDLYLTSLVTENDFEKKYLALRSKEGRLYPDEIVNNLPHIPIAHPHYQEWTHRNYLCAKVLNYLSRQKVKRVLDLGCGNGWFANKIKLYTQAIVLGLDINKRELKQAAALFTNDRCKFLLADINTDVLPEGYFDCIVLNSSIQYFPSPPELLNRLAKLVKPQGEIHIFNSPIYKNGIEAEKARSRSKAYFESMNIPEQILYYNHHTWHAFSTFKYQVLYDPRSILSYLSMRLFKHGCPFPWLITQIA